MSSLFFKGLKSRLSTPPVRWWNNWYGQRILWCEFEARSKTYYGFYLSREYLPANFTSSSETRLENMAVLGLYLINKVLLVAMTTLRK